MVEEKVVRRGEVWWLKSLDSFGHEYGAGRPIVVVSNDKGNKNNTTVIGVYLTSQKKTPLPVNVRVMVDGKWNTALCNQIITPDKGRLDRYICTLTEPEMIRISSALAIAVDVAVPEQPKREEPADVVALRSECDMWRRMYEKALDQLVDMRVAADMALLEKPPVVEQKPPVVKHEKPPVVKQKDPVPVDINYCSELALRELGLGDADVASVIACRPYESVLELNCVPDLDTGWVAANEHRFVCTPIVTEMPPVTKVNINTCGGKDLMELGVSSAAAYRITSDRKRNGPFLVVSDLLRVKGVGQKFLDTWADKLEV